MSHRQILQAMSGLLIAMFVAMLSSTIVTNALPTIVERLRGSQTGYTWVAASTLLSMTAATPIWGKLADLFSKKLLMQTALVIYVVASMVAGLSQSMGMLISARAVQGIGVGGVMAMVQICMAAMVSPRERGRYSGYIGATFALATVLGPLVGGVLVDSVSWRACFYVGAPIAVIALVVLQLTLHLPTHRNEGARIDYVGAFFIIAGVCCLLIWVTLAGTNFAWMSWESAVMVIGGLALLAVATYVEARVEQPIIPLRLFRDSTVSLATIASVFIGFAMMGATYYVSEYFQDSRGMSPTKAGLMSICMVGGLMFSSLVIGRIISTTGRWKKWLFLGSVLVVVGLALLGFIDGTTNRAVIGIFLVILGLGLGATNQNLVLAVQNNAAPEIVGSATATVSFFRSLGGAIGVSALGAVLNSQVSSRLADGVPTLVRTGKITADQAAGLSTGLVPDVHRMAPPLANLFERSFGTAAGHLFLISAPFAFLAFLAIVFIKEVPLRTSLKNLEEPEIAPDAAAELELGGALDGHGR